MPTQVDIQTRLGCASNPIERGGSSLWMRIKTNINLTGPDLLRSSCKWLGHKAQGHEQLWYPPPQHDEHQGSPSHKPDTWSKVDGSLCRELAVSERSFHQASAELPPCNGVFQNGSSCKCFSCLSFMLISNMSKETVKDLKWLGTHPQALHVAACFFW